MSDSILSLLPQIISAICVFTVAIFRYFRQTEVNEQNNNINVGTHDENTDTTTTTTTTTITTTETHHTHDDDDNIIDTPIIINTPIERTNSILNRINSFLKFQKEKY